MSAAHPQVTPPKSCYVNRSELFCRLARPEERYELCRLHRIAEIGELPLSEKPSEEWRAKLASYESLWYSKDDDMLNPLQNKRQSEAVLVADYTPDCGREDDHRIVGIAHLRGQETRDRALADLAKGTFCGVVDILTVAPDMRHGNKKDQTVKVGASLLQAVFNIARLDGYQVVAVPLLRTNEAAHAFCKAQGGVLLAPDSATQDHVTRWGTQTSSSLDYYLFNQSHRVR